MNNTNEWKEFRTGIYGSPESHSLLSRGDEVKLSARSRKIGGQVGIYKKRLPKNLSIIVDGQDWRVPPSLITHFRKGDPNNIPKNVDAVEVEVKRSSSALHDECKVGDVALFYRGKFDVVKIIELSPRLRCKALDGRGKGKIYSYKADLYVQKLHGDRIIIQRRDETLLSR